MWLLWWLASDRRRLKLGLLKMRMAGDPISVAENTQPRLHLLTRLTYLAGCDSHPSCHRSWPKLMMNPALLRHLKWPCQIRLLILIGHPCLSGMWLGVTFQNRIPQ